MKVNGKPTRQRKIDPSLASAFTQQGIHPVLARVYAGRGIQPGVVAPDISMLPDKSSLQNCMEAGAMLAESITSGQRIIIVGDYDADGATSTACMLRGIRGFGGDVDFVVPDRRKHGYGLGTEIARMAKEKGGELVCTVDNGVSAHAGVAEAKRLGMTVVLSDHHLQGDTLPKADCLVNPNLNDSTFASRALAGVGVAFYVLGALREEMRKRNSQNDFALGSLLDLVAVGTVGDLVPMDTCNRALVRMGMERIRARRASTGIQALLSVAGKNPATANSETAGFALAPRINAAGRLETADIGIRMLATDNMGEALRLAHDLDMINRERKTLQMDMTETALDIIDSMQTDGRNALVVFDGSFHEGVVGLVASRLKERFHRPSAAFAKAEDGTLKGSFRSIPGVHVRDVLDLVSKRAPGLVLKMGGHAMAAGASIDAGGFDKFSSLFDRAVCDLASDDAFSPELETDGVLAPTEMTYELAEAIARENWGQGFPAPLFEGRFRVLSQRPIGTGHLKLQLDVGAGKMDAVFFGREEPVGEVIEATYRLDLNEYNGERRLQIMIDGVGE